MAMFHKKSQKSTESKQPQKLFEPLESRMHLSITALPVISNTGWIYGNDSANNVKYVFDDIGSKVKVTATNRDTGKSVSRTVPDCGTFGFDTKGGNDNVEVWSDVRLVKGKLGSGNDYVKTSGPGEFKIEAGSGNDNVDGSGSTGKLTIYGQSGNDILRGGRGNDKIYGNVGWDKVYTSGGIDHLYGGDSASHRDNQSDTFVIDPDVKSGRAYLHGGGTAFAGTKDDYDKDQVFVPKGCPTNNIYFSFTFILDDVERRRELTY